MADSFFPPRPEDTPVDFFANTRELDKKAEESTRFITEIAERYSSRNGVPFSDIKAQAEVNGSSVVIPSAVPNIALSDQNIDYLYTRQYNVEKAVEAIKNFQTNSVVLATSGTATDVAEKVIVDPYSKVDTRAIDLAIIREEFAKITPDEGVLGSVASFFGLLAREATIGTIENFFQSKKGRGEDAFSRMAAEPDMTKKRIIAKQIALEAKDKGILGDNSLLMSQELHSILYQGKAEYEGWWAALDLGLLGAGKAFGAVGKGAAKTATVMDTVSQPALMASARDSIDVAKAVAVQSSDAALTSAIYNPETAAEIARHASPGMNRVAITSEVDKVYPSVNPVLRYEADNWVMQDLEKNFSRVNATQDIVNEASNRFLTNLLKTTGSHLVNFQRNYIGFDNYEMVVQLAKDDGSLFLTRESAEKFAQSFGGKVVPVLDKFTVEVSRNLSMKNVGKATEAQELKSFLFDMIASPEVTSSQRLNTILKMGTSAIGAVTQDISTKYRSIYKKIGTADKKVIGSIIEDLSDGKDSYRRSWYSVEEFKDKYYNITGKEASQEVIDGYVASNKLNEAAWYIEADEYFKSAVNQNTFIGSFDGIETVRLRPIERYQVPNNVKKVYNPVTKQVVDISKVKKGTRIYQAPDGIQVGDAVQQYVMGELKTSRRLYHSDVYGFQPGGSRARANVNAMVVQERTLKDLSGNAFQSRAKTIVAARTVQEAEKSVKDINTILKAFRDNTGIATGKITKDSLTNMDELNNVIRANNGFNPSIETVDDFMKFMDDAGIGLDDVKAVDANADIPRMGIGGLDYLQYGRPTKYKDLYKLNANPTSANRDKILYGYGNTGFKLLDPLTAIERDFARGVNYLAQRQYFKNAIEGMVKGGKKYMSNYNDVKDMGLYQQIKQAVFDTSTKEGEAFAREQRTILARMEEKSAFSKGWERRMNNLGKYIFNKFGYDVFDKMSFDPVVALRGFAFDLKLGLFNPDQFIVQSSSAAAIMSISPKFGLQAALSYMPMRAALTNPVVLQQAAKRTAKFTGMTEEAFTEMMEYMKRSGRFEIDQTVQEINGSYDLGLGALQQLRKTGRVFFNEGERVVRLVANNVAYREFRLKYPKLDIKTEQGFRTMDEFITHRADALTMNMTSASAAGWQKGLLSVPTQWMSYNARMLENLFFNRNLTLPEKMRLGFGQLAFYGAAGWGAGGALNLFIDKTSTEMDPEVYTLLRYGMADFLISELTGVQTGLGGRLAVGEGIVDTLGNLTGNQSFVEVLGGPSATIAADTLTASISLVESLVTGNFNIAKADFNKALRNVSTWDKGVRAAWIVQTGQYLSRNGQIQASNLTPEAAILNALGAKLQAVEMQFELNEIIKDDKALVDQVSKDVREMKSHMWDAIKNGDMAAAKEFGDQINLLKAPLTMSQRIEVESKTRASLLEFSDRVIQNAITNNHSALALQYQKVLNTGANK